MTGALAGGAPRPPNRRWLWALYASVLVPFVGPTIVILVSSWLYYRLRGVDPNRARWLNRHAWIAVLGNAAVVIVLRHVLRR
jgi:hypothetical protein